MPRHTRHRLHRRHAPHHLCLEAASGAAGKRRARLRRFICVARPLRPPRHRKRTWTQYAEVHSADTTMYLTKLLDKVGHTDGSIPARGGADLGSGLMGTQVVGDPAPRGPSGLRTGAPPSHTATGRTGGTARVIAVELPMPSRASDPATARFPGPTRLLAVWTISRPSTAVTRRNTAAQDTPIPRMP